MSEVWRWLHRLRMVWAVLAAFALGSLLIVAAGKNPLTAYQALFQGAFFDYHGLADTLVKMCPMLLAGLAVIIPMRCGLLNVGAEGQIYIGGLAAAAVALYCRRCLRSCMCCCACWQACWAVVSGVQFRVICGQSAASTKSS